MTRALRTIVAAMFVVSLAAPAALLAASANEVYKGTLVCAKCGLQKADAHECQDVLVVEGDNGTTTEYYITKNEVAEKSGEACTLKIPATVTGTVAKGEDGKLWLTPSKIDKQ